MTDKLDPIEMLLGFSERTRAVLGLLDGPHAGRAWRWFDAPAAMQRRILETVLYPAMIESMAGSDAVCIRELTLGLRNTRYGLDGQWRTAAMTPPADWLAGWLAHLDVIDEELLPMAARLLDAAAFAELARECDALRVLMARFDPHYGSWAGNKGLI